MTQVQSSSKFGNIMQAAVIAAILFLIGPAATAEISPVKKPFLHPLFSDHMMMQRDVKVPVWGWTTPGQKITVTLQGRKATAVAGRDGRWETKLGPLAAGGPYTMEVSGDTTVTVNDVLVGDVWLCSGQSNMEMGVGACGATNDIAQSDFPRIRLLTVPRAAVGEPLLTTQCRWLPCNSNTIMQGQWAGFSAAGYFFGREIHQKTGVPVGLIHSSWGGTVAEAWTSLDGLEKLPDFRDRARQLADEGKAAKPAQDEMTKKFEDWYLAHDPGTSNGWFKPGINASSWINATMPQAFELAGLPDFDGIVWFRKVIEVPDNWAGQDLKLSLGKIDDMDTTWFNGVPVGHNYSVNIQRVYSVPGSVVKAGRNVISVRVLDTGGPGGLTGETNQLHLDCAGNASTSSMSLAGEWQMQASTAFTNLPPHPPVNDPGNPNTPMALYNGMIAPLVPFAIKGAIWYQGEANAGRARQYRDLLAAMIGDWRRHFEEKDFPFYIVQLAAFQKTSPVPRDSDWAELRESQAYVASHVPHCALAVAIEIGEHDDIHPKDKLDVGKRLALCALANTYGTNIEWSGPVYAEMNTEGAQIRLNFSHAENGLVAEGGKLTGFAVAGEDHKFVFADARIENNTVLVSSPQVPKPVAVRYAWDDYPECNLYNQDGLPAVPFRTDSWPRETSAKK